MSPALLPFTSATNAQDQLQLCKKYCKRYIASFAEGQNESKYTGEIPNSVGHLNNRLVKNNDPTEVLLGSVALGGLLEHSHVLNVQTSMPESCIG